MMKSKLIALTFILFTLSGFSGLIYEGVWARYLKLLLGHSAYGQILTLCIYMGGLGIGAFLAVRLLPRIRRPLFAYAVTEACIGLGGFAYHTLYTTSTDLLFSSGILLGMGITTATCLKLILAILITGPFAVLLGMTFPFITSGLIRILDDQGEASISRMYFTNSLGAAIGIIILSFWLIPALGTHGALMTSASINLLIAGLFFLISQRLEAKYKGTIQSIQADSKRHPVDRGFVRTMLVIAFLTGFSSFLYEISWIRMLAMAFGSSTHAFDLMLSAFILGLALGSLWVKRLQKNGQELRWLILAQAFMAIAAALTVFNYTFFFNTINQLNLIFQRSAEAYPWMSVVKYGLSMLLMCPTSFFAGMTLPLITFALCKRTGEEAFTGRVYGWNTLGSIAGAALGGLVLLPWLQLGNTISFGALVDLVLGITVAGSAGLLWNSKSRVVLISLAIGLIVVLASFGVQMNYHTLTQGSYRGFASVAPRTEIQARDGVTATISFHSNAQSMTLKTNGKPDASLSVTDPTTTDATTQATLAWLPIASRTSPDYSAAIIGFGSGMTAHYLLADPRLKHLDVIEIEKEMVELARGFHPRNQRAYEDPRSQIVIQDARTFFASSDRKYDMIISEPSNPWVSGVSSLFTTEFYLDLKRYMTPGGVVAQWFHTYEMTDDILLSVIKSLGAQFQYLEMYRVDGEDLDLVILASDNPIALDPHRLMDPTIQADMTPFRIEPAKLCRLNYVASKPSFELMASLVKANSEYDPVVDNLAEKAMFLKSHSELSLIFRPIGALTWHDLMEPARFGVTLDLNYTTVEKFNVLRQHLPKDSMQGAAFMAQVQKIVPAFAWRDSSVQRLFLGLVDSIVATPGLVPAKVRRAYEFRRNFWTAPALSDSIRHAITMLDLAQADEALSRDLLIASFLRQDIENARIVASDSYIQFMGKRTGELSLVDALLE